MVSLHSVASTLLENPGLTQRVSPPSTHMASRSSPRSVVRETTGGPSLLKTVKSPSLVFSNRAAISSTQSDGGDMPTTNDLPDESVTRVSRRSPLTASSPPISLISYLIRSESPKS